VGGIRVNACDQSATRTSGNSAHVGARARQSIAPATRRAVRLRDHRRCVVPGCRNVQFLDLHHIELRSKGGGNDADNLVTLCAVHHRAVHRGALSISGRVSRGVVFRHADGRDYGAGVNPSQVEALASTFVALRGLGFREGEIRRAQAEVSNSGAGEEGNIERLLRATLAKLTRSRGT
jgi:HNH endonuclease/RuvA, C-terminal domain